MRRLLFLIFLMWCTVSAQVDLTTLFCDDAIEVCLEGLEFHTTMQADIGHPDYCSPNSLVHNPRYLAFTPVASTIDITVEITECTSGGALQYAILDTCAWTNENVIACDPLFDDTSTQTVNDLIAGKQYYLMVEGANAAICGFRVSISNITGGTYPGELGPVVGPDVFTPGQTLELTLPDAIQDQYYLWSVPWLEELVATDMAFLSIVIPVDVDGSQLDICVTPAAGCIVESCITILLNQVDTDLTPLTCQEAIEFCPDGLTLQTQPLPAVGHAEFCGPNTLIHNPRYLRFTPIDTTVHLNIEITNCSTGTGLQMAVVDTCDWDNTDVIACDPGFSMNSHVTLNELTISKSYYLVVDGLNAATCSFQVSMTNIAGGQYPGVLDTMYVSDTMAEGHALEFGLGSGAVQRASYVWSVPWLDSPVTTDTAYLAINAPCVLRATQYSICVRPVIGCVPTVCLTDTLDPVAVALPVSDTSVTVILPPDRMTTLVAADLFSLPPGCTGDLQFSFDKVTHTPTRKLSCADLQMNGGPYFLEDIWLSDRYGHQIRIPVTLIVRDTTGLCLPADVPRDTLQRDTAAFSALAAPVTGLGIAATFAVEWSPNPWHHFTDVLITADKATHGRLILYNTMGQIVYRQVLDVRPGINTVRVSADQCEGSGLLIYEIRLGTNIKTGKLVVTK